MPTGRLTPLGRQLRTVLANLTAKHTQNSYQPGLPSSKQFTANAFHRVRNESRIGRISLSNPEPAATEEIESNEFRPRNLKRRSKRIDHLTDALKDVGKGDLIRELPAGKVDLSYVNLKRRDGFHNAAVNARRHAEDVLPDPASPHNLSLERIVGNYIRSTKSDVEVLQAEWSRSYAFSETELQFIHRKGYTQEHIAIWADIVTTPDSLSAARKLQERVASSLSTPVFVLLHLLRRAHIPAAALRILVQCTIPMLYGSSRSHVRPQLNAPPLFLAIIRLLRHARLVWPQAMTSVVSIWLQHLERVDESTNGQHTYDQLQTRTFELNKLLSLTSLRTAISPLKVNAYQEAAIVPILQYMSEHKPPLLVDRTGYRAVVRVQLGQRKTDREQQWAELKALSWPPWKVDRTGMDVSIGLDYGISRAGATLNAMQSAGYTPLEWEKVARLYAGWDTDGTPTIQRRALLGLPGFLRSESRPPRISLWAARIECTRTLQEAWACYLAWEDLHKPHDQNVYLAMFSKLSLAAKIPSTVEAEDNDGAWPVYAGDRIEISPPPRSTHLHTYTRTRPPTVDEFYMTLRERGVVFQGHCLAFLVRNASSLSTGLGRLRDSSSVYPQLGATQAMQTTSNLAQLPDEVFAAMVHLSARFAMHPNPKRAARYKHLFLLSLLSSRDHGLTGLNTASGVARAAELLYLRPASSAQIYLNLLSALASQSRSINLHIDHQLDINEGITEASKHLQSVSLQAGALVAYDLMRRTLTLYTEHHHSLDMPMFIPICQCTEHAAWAAWFLLRNELDPQPSTTGNLHPNHLLDAIDKAKSMVTNKTAARYLVKQFNHLVGTDTGPLADSPSSVEADSPPIPRLLAIPSSVVLHRYIRALGWLGAYDELLALVKWMCAHQVELATRRSQDRGGEKYLIQALVALRVFLERSWIVEPERKDELGGDLEKKDAKKKDEEIVSILERLRRPAERELVDECRELVESVEEWGGWATDEEVRAYVKNKSRFEIY